MPDPGRPCSGRPAAGRHWNELVLRLPAEEADEAAFELAGFGVQGTWQTVPGAPGATGDAGADLVELHAFFKPTRSPEAALRELERRLGRDRPDDPRGPIPHEVRVVAEEPWGDMWKAHFVPQEVAPGLWVARPHARVPPEARRDGVRVLRIHPSNAFGTGNHGTTRLCLQRVQAAVSGAGGRPGPVLDVGTGSGILAIAALVLGAPRALGVDLDLESVREARRNARRNRVQRRLAVALAGPEAIRGTFPLVLANLTAPTLAAVAGPLAARLADGGVLVASGFQVDEEAEVRATFAPHGLAGDEPAHDGSWSSLAFRRARAGRER